MGAKSKPQETLSLADLGIDAAARRRGAARGRRCSRLGGPPPRGETLKIEDDGSAAQKIVDFLAERKLAVKTLVFLEHHDGELQKGALGVLSKAASLGEAAGVVVGAGAGAARRARRRSHGAAQVYVADGAGARGAAAAAARRRARARSSQRRRLRHRALRTVGARRRRRRRARGAARRRPQLGSRPTSATTDGQLVGMRPALGDTVYVDVGWRSTPRARALPLRQLRAGRDGRRGARSSTSTAELRDVLDRRRRSRGTTLEEQAGPVDRGRRRDRRRRPRARRPGGLRAARGAREGARRRGRGDARGRRRRLVPVPDPGRPDGEDGLAEALHRLRHLRRDPAQGRACRARARSSPSTRIRTRRSSSSATSASSATSTRSSRS